MKTKATQASRIEPPIVTRIPQGYSYIHELTFWGCPTFANYFRQMARAGFLNVCLYRKPGLKLYNMLIDFGTVTARAVMRECIFYVMKRIMHMVTLRSTPARQRKLASLLKEVQSAWILDRQELETLLNPEPA